MSKQLYTWCPLALTAVGAVLCIGFDSSWWSVFTTAGVAMTIEREWARRIQRAEAQTCRTSPSICLQTDR